MLDKLNNLAQSPEWQRARKEAADKSFEAGRLSLHPLSKHAETGRAEEAVDRAMRRAVALARSEGILERPKISIRITPDVVSAEK